MFDEFLITPKVSYDVQETITFAAFWKDVLHYDDYLKFVDCLFALSLLLGFCLRYNSFLADINNERETKNAQYRSNVLKLKSFVLFYGLLDKIVVPNTSPIFSFFAPGNVSDVVPFEQSGQYTGDWLGLKTLQDRGALHFYSVNCSHSGAITSACKSDIWPKTIPYLK